MSLMSLVPVNFSLIMRRLYSRVAQYILLCSRQAFPGGLVNQHNKCTKSVVDLAQIVRHLEHGTDKDMSKMIAPTSDAFTRRGPAELSKGHRYCRCAQGLKGLGKNWRGNHAHLQALKIFSSGNGSL